MKKARNISSILFQIIIFLISLFFPFFNLSFDAATILTSVALLFTILIGFFIAAATSNYLRLQSLISDEDAKLISLFGIAKLVNPSKQEELADLIDKYMIAALDYDLLGYTSSTAKEFDDLTAAVNAIEPSSEVGFSLMQNLHDIKGNLISIRQEALISFKRTVSGYHWFILVSLSIVMSFILIGLREDIISSFIIGLSLIALYQSLNLLHKIDSCSFLADRIGYENPQYVFSAIGRDNYYPEHAITEKLKKDMEGKTYRIGFYKNFPETFDKNIETFK